MGLFFVFLKIGLLDRHPNVSVFALLFGGGWEQGAVNHTFRGHTSYVFCVDFHPRSHIIASGSFDQTVKLWDVRSGDCIKSMAAHSEPVTSVNFNRDGTLIASCSFDGLRCAGGLLGSGVLNWRGLAWRHTVGVAVVVVEWSWTAVQCCCHAWVQSASVQCRPNRLSNAIVTRDVVLS